MDRQRGDRVPDAGEGVAVVRRGSGPQAHLGAVFAGDDAVAVELDLVQPAGARRRPVGERGLARQDEAGRLRDGATTTRGVTPEHT